MKRIYVPLIALSLSFVTLGQSSKELSIGIGPSFFGWGDVIGISATGTYSYSLNKHFAIEPRIILSTGWNSEDVSYNSGEYYNYGYNHDQTSYLAAAASVV